MEYPRLRGEDIAEALGFAAEATPRACRGSGAGRPMKFKLDENQSDEIGLPLALGPA